MLINLYNYKTEEQRTITLDDFEEEINSGELDMTYIMISFVKEQ